MLLVFFADLIPSTIKREYDSAVENNPYNTAENTYVVVQKETYERDLYLGKASDFFRLKDREGQLYITNWDPSVGYTPTWWEDLWSSTNTDDQSQVVN